MIKKLRYLFTLMLLLVASVGWADEVFYTLDGTVTGGTSGYAAESEITQGDISWKVMGNTTMNPWRIGGKSLTNEERPVYSTTAMGSAISKVVLSLGTGANVTINSVKLIVASDANFSNVLDQITKESVTLNGDNEFTPTNGTEWAKNSFYKVIFNLTITETSNKYVQLKEVKFYRNPSAGQVATPTFSPAAGTYVGSQNVTISTATDGATIYYTQDGSDPTTDSNVYNGAITISENTTLKAMAAKAGSDNSVVASAEYRIVSIEHDGTQADPYTVSDAIAAIDAETGTNEKYVTGIVSKIVTAYSSQYGNISYNISVDGTTEGEQLQAYRGKSYNGENFTSADDIQVGDIVVVKGNLVKYNSTYEFEADNQLVSLERHEESKITVAETSVNVAAAGGEGTIAVTYSNIDEYDLQILDAEGNVETYDWLSAELNTDGAIEYTVEANTGEERKAYLQVYGLDAEANDVLSDIVTITQAAYVAPEAPGSWVLTPLADLTSSDVFVIVGNNADTYAMSNDNGTSSAPAAVVVTISEDGKTLTGDVADNIKWNISGNATDGYTFYPNGETEKWLYCTNSNNGMRVGTNDNKSFTVSEEGYLFNSATSRYVGIYNSQDWRCYTSINNNIADQTFSFYKKVEATPEPETVTVTITSAGYATFANKKAVDFSGTDVTVMTAKYDATTGKIDYTEVESKKVPAGAAVVLKGEADNYTANVIESADALQNNDLQVNLDEDILVNGTQYCLAKKDGVVGFYKVKDGDHVKAGKAYLVITDANAKDFYGFDDDATGIDGLNVNDNVNANEVFDLQGRRVARPTKGIYIVNGKKVVIKK